MYDTIISSESLEILLQERSDLLVIIDCRFRLMDTEKGRLLYQEGHIPQAHYAHLDEDLSGSIQPNKTGRHPLPKVSELSKKLGQWGVDGGKQVVVYDDMGGAIASRLWWMLKWLGHDSVAVLDGGYQGWVAKGRAVSQDIPMKNDLTDFISQERNDMVVAVSEVEAISQKRQSGLLIDARSRERYEGEVEPIDPVAGHIPGAVNVPHTSHLDENRYWKDGGTIAKKFMALKGMEMEKDLICYCGSGVTACFNVLALTVAGFKNAKLYPGSWSHWITDPRRKIE